MANDYESILRPFNVANIRIPVGSYQFTTGRVGYTFGQQRPVSGAVLYEQGEFYDGTRKALTFNRARVNLSSRLQFEPSVTLNWIDVPFGRATTKLVSSRVTYTMTPLMFGSALVQYNSTTNTVSVNARLRWEYSLGSELFVVYNEERFSDAAGLVTPVLQNRSFIVKVNRFFRF